MDAIAPDQIDLLNLPSLPRPAQSHNRHIKNAIAHPSQGDRVTEPWQANPKVTQKSPTPSNKNAQQCEKHPERSQS